MAVANARERVKAEAHYVTPNSGGYGAARDAIEFVLEARGILDEVIENYLNESTSIAPSMDIGKGGRFELICCGVRIEVQPQILRSAQDDKVRGD